MRGINEARRRFFRYMWEINDKWVVWEINELHVGIFGCVGICGGLIRSGLFRYKRGIFELNGL